VSARLSSNTAHDAKATDRNMVIGEPGQAAERRMRYNETPGEAV
jgi:hypothetical protein